MMRTGQVVTVSVRWQTGACTRLDVRLQSHSDISSTHPDTVLMIRELAGSALTDLEIAGRLNEAGILSKRDHRFKAAMVASIRRYRGIQAGRPVQQAPDRASVSPTDGRVKIVEVARAVGVTPQAVIDWCNQGLLDGYQRKEQACWWVIWNPEALSKLKALKPSAFARSLHSRNAA
jgi:hypothetical protein